MELVIHGLTEILFVDIILIWLFVNLVIIVVFMIYAILFIDSGLLTINDNNIIKKILKLKNTDEELYKFANKLDKDNIEFLHKYKILKLDRVILTTNLNQNVKPIFVNDNEKRLYKKIESILYYYDLIGKGK